MANTNATLDKNDDVNAEAHPQSTIDKLTGTSPEDRQDFIARAQETLSDAVTGAIDAVKANPKTAAAIAAGATAAVAGAAYGATKLAKGATKTGGTTKRPPAKRAAAKRTAAKKD